MAMESESGAACIASERKGCEIASYTVHNKTNTDVSSIVEFQSQLDAR